MRGIRVTPLLRSMGNRIRAIACRAFPGAYQRSAAARSTATASRKLLPFLSKYRVAAIARYIGPAGKRATAAGPAKAVNKLVPKTYYRYPSV